MLENNTAESAMLRWPILVTTEKTSYQAQGECYALVRLAVSCSKTLNDVNASTDVIKDKVGQACVENAFAVLGLNPERKMTMKEFLSGLYDNIEGCRDEFFSIIPESKEMVRPCEGSAYFTLQEFRDRLLKYAEVEKQMKSTASDQCKTMLLNIIMADIPDGDRSFTSKELLIELVCGRVSLSQGAAQVTVRPETAVAGNQDATAMMLQDKPKEESISTSSDSPTRVNFEELKNAPFDRDSMSHVLANDKVTVVVDALNIWFSEDLATWRKAKVPDGYDVSGKKMKCENSIFISWDGCSGIWSSDGEKWKKFEVDLGEDNYGGIKDIIYHDEYVHRIETDGCWVIVSSVKGFYSRCVPGLFKDSYETVFYEKPVILVSEETRGLFGSTKFGGDYKPLDIDFADGLVLSDNGDMPPVVCSLGNVFVLCKYDDGYLYQKGLASRKKGIYEVHAYDFEKSAQYKFEFKNEEDVSGPFLVKDSHLVTLWFVNENNGEIRLKGHHYDSDDAKWDDAEWEGGALEEGLFRSFRLEMVRNMMGVHRLETLSDYVSLGVPRDVDAGASPITLNLGMSSFCSRTVITNLMWKGDISSELPPDENSFAVFKDRILLKIADDGGRQIYVGKFVA